MRTLKVLFGFNHDVTSKMIIQRLESYDCRVDASYRFTKLTIKDFIEKNNDLDIVFLKEYLDGGEKYSALEMSDLADTSRSKFIPVIRSSNRGREAVKILYCAGILDCIFAEGRAGADPKLLADLAMHGRTRLDARKYYRIDAPMPDYGVLSYEDYVDSYNYLLGRDVSVSSMIDRFIDLSKCLSPKQLSRFIDNLPEEDLKDLLLYEEFYDIQNKLYSTGIMSRRFKKPRNIRRAIDGEPLGQPEEVPDYETPVTNGLPPKDRNDPVPENGMFQQAMGVSATLNEHRASNMGAMVYQGETPSVHIAETPLPPVSQPVPVTPAHAGMDEPGGVTAAPTARQRLSDMSLDDILKAYAG